MLFFVLNTKLFNSNTLNYSTTKTVLGRKKTFSSEQFDSESVIFVLLVPGLGLIMLGGGILY